MIDESTDAGQSGNASQEEERGPLELESVTVTGELRERTLQVTRTSAIVITAEELKRRSDNSLIEVLDRTPGVVPNGEGFSVRGIPYNGVGFAGSGLTVSTQIDGVALPNFNSTRNGTYSMWDINQVEVLLGPQSTQQGRNALAGAIIINPNDPTFDQEFAGRAEFASRDFQRYSAMANVPLLDDELALRVSADVLRETGLPFNTFRDEEADERENDYFRAALRWSPNDRLDAVLSASYSNTVRGVDLVIGPSFPSSFDVAFDNDGGEDAENTIVRLELDYVLSDRLTFTSQTNYFSFDQVTSRDLDFTPARLFNDAQDIGSRVVEQDFQLAFEYEKVVGTVGMFYSEIKPDNRFIFSIDAGALTGIPPLAGVTVSQNSTDRSNVQNLAVFGEVDVRLDWLSPDLSLTLGARYDDEDFDLDVGIMYDIPPEASFLAAAFQDEAGGGSTSYDAFLPKVGLTYDYTQDQSFSLVYQQGYRGGGVSTVLGGSVAFDAESTDNIELAYRGSFLDDRIRVRANAFHTDWTDQQVTATTILEIGGNELEQPTTVNAGESRLFGGELSVEADLSAQFSLFGTVAYVNSEFTTFVENANTDNAQDFAGNEFAFSPEITAYLGGSYAWENGLRFEASAAYTGSHFTDPENFIPVDDRWVLYADLGYQYKNYTLSVYVRNLLDEEYLPIGDGFPSFLGPPIQTRLGEPRTVGAFVRYDF
ncbi:MAG: TonB-dependent receptor [Pseudomonadota bacterium]